MAEIKITTYEQDRLYFFVDQVSLAQKKYNRLFKTFKDAPYLSEGAQFLSDAGRELQFYKDVVEMLDKGYRKQEWISVDDRLPEESGEYLVFGRTFGNKKPKIWICECISIGFVMGWCNSAKNPIVEAWMPLPEPPKTKGGAE
jgi:hypothetical protein